MGNRIEDEFSALPISNQRRYQLRAKRNSKCVVCGEPSPGKSLCSLHRTKKNYRNAMKRVAHSAIVHALANKWITRQPCEVCGKAAHVYHEDYLKPMDVHWLCRKHAKGFDLWVFQSRQERGEKEQEWE